MDFAENKDIQAQIMEDVQTVKKESTFEKHIQTILLGVITSLLVMGLQYMFRINEQLIRQDERQQTYGLKVDQLVKEMQEMKQEQILQGNRITIVEQKFQK